MVIVNQWACGQLWRVELEHGHQKKDHFFHTIISSRIRIDTLQPADFA